MSRPDLWLLRVALLLVIGCCLKVGTWSPREAEAGTARRYTGIELLDMRAGFNNHASVLDDHQSILETLTARLDSDPGVGFTNYTAIVTGAITSGTTSDTFRP